MRTTFPLTTMNPAAPAATPGEMNIATAVLVVIFIAAIMLFFLLTVSQAKFTGYAYATEIQPTSLLDQGATHAWDFYGNQEICLQKNTRCDIRIFHQFASSAESVGSLRLGKFSNW